MNACRVQERRHYNHRPHHLERDRIMSADKPKKYVVNPNKQGAIPAPCNESMSFRQGFTQRLWGRVFDSNPHLTTAHESPRHALDSADWDSGWIEADKRLRMLNPDSSKTPE